MLARGLAYRCYASREELDALREAQMARGEKPRYDGRWRPENAQGKAPPPGVTPVIRFRNPDAGDVAWNDLVKGPISIANSELDDLGLARGADLVPTYNFAVMVDDIDMAITHVMQKYASFVAMRCKEERLIPFDRTGVAKVIEIGSRLAEHQNKLTSRFSDVADIIREASYWASKSKSRIVTEDHVLKGR